MNPTTTTSDERSTGKNNDTEEQETVPAAPHLEQSIPYEWRAYEIADETLIVHDVPEDMVACYRIAKKSRNPRVLAGADAVLYEGKVAQSFYDEELKSVLFTHSWAGRIDRVYVEDWLDSPAVVLEECDSADLTGAVKDLEQLT